MYPAQQPKFTREQPMFTENQRLFAVDNISAVNDTRVLRSYFDNTDFEVMIKEVENGANEICLSFLGLDAHTNGTLFVTDTGNWDMNAFLEAKSYLKNKGYNVRYLGSIGGWNSPHAPPAWYNAPTEKAVKVFEDWNRADPKYGGWKVDGIDWDYEGFNNFNNVSNPETCYTQELLDFMGLFSTALADRGYFISMVPMQSQLDIESSDYNTCVNNTYPFYRPEFHYRAQNLYAYLLAKYPNAFSCIAMQLYETYGRAAYDVYEGKYSNLSLSDANVQYLVDYVLRVKNLGDSWVVKFSEDPESGLGDVPVLLPFDKMLFGFIADANVKKMYSPTVEQIQKAMDILLSDHGIRVKGLFYWSSRYTTDHPDKKITQGLRKAIDYNNSNVVV